MFDDEEGLSLGSKGMDIVDELFHEGTIHTRPGFIEENHLRIRHQGAGQLQQLLLSG